MDTTTSQSLHARQLLVQILRNPEEFEMTKWYAKGSCGTTACLAGHAALLMGWRPVNEYSETYFEAYKFTRDGEVLEASTLGQLFLALDDDAASALFMDSSRSVALMVLAQAAQGVPITFDLVHDEEERWEGSERSFQTLVEDLQAEYLTPEELGEIKLRNGE